VCDGGVRVEIDIMTPSRFPIMDQHADDIPIYLIALFWIFPEEATGIRTVAARNAKNKERVCMIEQSNFGAFRMNHIYSSTTAAMLSDRISGFSQQPTARTT